MIVTRPVPAAESARSLPAVFGIAAAGAYLGVLAWGMSHWSYDVWGGLLMAPVLLGVSIPLLLNAARRDDDNAMTQIVIAGLVLKLVGSVVRYVVSFELYDRADATSYDEIGRQIAAAIRGGDLSPSIHGPGGEGTHFLETVTGWVFAIAGPSKLAGFLIFSWLGFWGVYLFYRAFRLAFPAGNFRRYALLVFFLPSILFWPASIGKDAWITFALGVTAYGAARLLTRRRAAYLLLAAGLWGTAMVRPHVTLLAFIALAFGFLLRRSPKGSVLGPTPKAIGIGVLTVAAVLIVGRVESFFGVSGVDTQSAESVFDETQRRSTAGDSRFEAARVESPLDFPKAAAAVLFRPYPNEVGNVQSLIASLEGMTLLALCLRSLGRFRSVPRTALRTPYVAVALVFTLAFIYAFSSVGNFGIIARQRVQVFPFLLVLLAVPPLSRRAEVDHVGR